MLRTCLFFFAIIISKTIQCDLWNESCIKLKIFSKIIFPKEDVIIDNSDREDQQNAIKLK